MASKKTPAPEAAPTSPTLADLAHVIGSDRFDALEKQAAVFRAWSGEAFRANAERFLQHRLRHAPTDSAALRAAANDLLTACGSAPLPAEEEAR